MKIKFLVLTNGKNVGDDNNAIAIANKVAEQLKSIPFNKPGVEVINTAVENISAIVTKVNEQNLNQVYIIGAGEHQLQHFKTLSDIKPAKAAVWLSHQPCNAMKDAFDYVDYFILPKALLNIDTFAAEGLDYNAFQTKRKLQSVELIPHDKTLKSIQAAFENWPEKFTTQKSIIFLLSGDAPLPGGKINFFTEEEAKELANQVAKKAADETRFIYVTNGPRTGQYDHKTGQKIESVHKENTSLDTVSQAFIEQLKLKELVENNNFQLLDFKFLDKGGVKSALSPLYHHAVTQDSLLYIPGETSSGISEVISLGLGGKMEIYNTGSMNQNHHKFVNYLKGKDLAKIPNPVDEVVSFFLTIPSILQNYVRLGVAISTSNEGDEKFSTTVLQHDASSSGVNVDLGTNGSKILNNIGLKLTPSQKEI